MSESNGNAGGERPRRGPLRRSLDVFVFAPVGLAVTALEDLPDVVAKGKARVELELSNARIVGRFVVAQKQREMSERLQEMRREGAPAPESAATPAAAPEDNGAFAARTVPVQAEAASDSDWNYESVPKPPPDAAAAAVVSTALSDYDTLSASQVVRRLEGLGPDVLRAVQRYEASHRNRRTILNRAGQLLEEGSLGDTAG